MKTPERKLEQAANAWWRNHRPLSYKLVEHLNNPAVNCLSPIERKLALAVVENIKSKRAARTPNDAGSLQQPCYVPPRSPIEAMIDAATGYVEPEPIRPTKEQKEAAQNLANDVMSDLRYYYPDVLKNRPTTWPIHLRNTIAAKAAWMLAAHNS
jgi:hypothetical protein